MDLYGLINMPFAFAYLFALRCARRARIAAGLAAPDGPMFHVEQVGTHA